MHFFIVARGNGFPAITYSSILVVADMDRPIFWLDGPHISTVFWICSAKLE